MIQPLALQHCPCPRQILHTALKNTIQFRLMMAAGRRGLGCVDEAVDVTSPHWCTVAFGFRILNRVKRSCGILHALPIRRAPHLKLLVMCQLACGIFCLGTLGTRC